MKKFRKTMALLTITAMLYQILFPTVVYALTSGPTQPEVASFTPVGVSDMVNTFTGDMTYNIPLVDVGGYPINISYESGINMDQEASWVGLGWTLNPGSITRQLRGLPDDFYGDPVTKKFSMRPDETIGIMGGANLELSGNKKPKFSLGLDGSVFHNSYKGYGTSFGVSPTITAGESGGSSCSVGLGFDFNSQEGVSASASVKYSKTEDDETGACGFSGGIGSRSGLKAITFSAESSRNYYRKNKKGEDKNDRKGNRISASATDGSISSSISFGSSTYNPSTEMMMKTTSYAYNASLGLEVYPSNPNFRLTGYGSVTEVDDKIRNFAAYGYIYSDAAKNGNSAMHDFNRKDDLPYVPDKPVLPFPVSTYDLFSVNGEGMNGQFRAYRSSAAILYDARSGTTSSNNNFGAHVGSFNAFKGGADLDMCMVNVKTECGLLQMI
jgi:hypothetical protein